jgi:hypothetical protein
MTRFGEEKEIIIRLKYAPIKKIMETITKKALPAT